MEQMKRVQNGDVHVWDDSRFNKTARGDLFAYINNSVQYEDGRADGKVFIYIIKAAHSPEHCWIHGAVMLAKTAGMCWNSLAYPFLRALP